MKNGKENALAFFFLLILGFGVVYFVILRAEKANNYYSEINDLKSEIADLQSNLRDLEYQVDQLKRDY